MQSPDSPILASVPCVIDMVGAFDVKMEREVAVICLGGAESANNGSPLKLLFLFDFKKRGAF
jgi:hypothetical protein